MLREIISALNLRKGFGSKSIRDLFVRSGEDEILNSHSHLLETSEYKYFKQSLEKQSISYLTFLDKDYPQLLKNIPDFPVILFYKGTYKSEKLANSLTIVGTRKFTSYGKSNATMLTKDLVNVGFSTISGMALGIDSIIHEVTIENSGYTVAVLGAPVDQPSPLANKYIYDRIIAENSLVISEYAPGTKVSPGMFAHRNRIVAGLSLGTIVIEAGLNSGSLITANLAFDYSREVFAIPGNIGQQSTQGNNKLIKEGKAKLIENTSDIITEFGFSGYGLNENLKKESLENLTEKERLIYDRLLSESKTLDELVFLMNKSVSELSSVLSVLEMKNVVRKDERGKFQIV